MTCLGQIIEYSVPVLRYGIFSHGKLALTGNCLPTNRIGCAFLMSVENELLLGGVGRKIGEGIHKLLIDWRLLVYEPKGSEQQLDPNSASSRQHPH